MVASGVGYMLWDSNYLAEKRAKTDDQVATAVARIQLVGTPTRIPSTPVPQTKTITTAPNQIIAKATPTPSSTPAAGAKPYVPPLITPVTSEIVPSYYDVEPIVIFPVSGIPIVTTNPKAGEKVPVDGFPDQLEQIVMTYSGSQQRMHNTELAITRLNGTIVHPGQVFSFNDSVGEISRRTGYISQYAELDVAADANGINQVVTAVFQAAFSLGMEIRERNWHTYWFPRYATSQGLVGLDAVVNQQLDEKGNKKQWLDLKWKNNTQNRMLIEAVIEGEDLVVTFYGTGMNRKVSSRQAITGIITPELLKADEIKQGYGFQVELLRTVTEGTKVSSQTFRSWYLPYR